MKFPGDDISETETQVEPGIYRDEEHFYAAQNGKVTGVADTLNSLKESRSLVNELSQLSNYQEWLGHF